jgi:ABC-type phosphate transport system substrate-binding protein
MLRTLTVILTLWLMISSAYAVEVIVQRGVVFRSLSQSQVRAMFGMRQPKWSDGTSVKVFVLADLNAVHAAFCKEKLDLFPYQLRQSWDRLVYSGIGQAPTEVASEEEMISRVSTTPGAIGYVRKVNANDPIHTISVQ